MVLHASPPQSGILAPPVRRRQLRYRSKEIWSQYLTVQPFRTAGLYLSRATVSSRRRRWAFDTVPRICVLSASTRPEALMRIRAWARPRNSRGAEWTLTGSAGCTPRTVSAAAYAVSS